MRGRKVSVGSVASSRMQAAMVPKLCRTNQQFQKFIWALLVVPRNLDAEVSESGRWKPSDWRWRHQGHGFGGRGFTVR